MICFQASAVFALAARWAGIETLQFCEIEPFCQKVLTKNFPGVPIHDDITTFDGKPFRGRVGWVFGGFPCQDLSAAGKGQGFFNEDGSHTRSGLWFEMLRVVTECRPNRIVIENVPALRTRGIDTVLEGLETAGYTCWPLVVGADDVGAPHRRKRVWIVGIMDDSGYLQGRRIDGSNERDNTQAGWELYHAEARDAIEDVAQSGSRNAKSSTRRRSRSSEAPGTGTRSGSEGSSDGLAAAQMQYGNEHGCEAFIDRRGGKELADANSSGRREQCGSIDIQPELTAAECDCGELAYSAERGVRCGRRSWQEFAACFKGFPPGPAGDWSNIDPEFWPTEQPIRYKTDGLPGQLVRRQLGSRAAILRGLGNAVCPQVAYAVIQAVKQL